MTSETHSRQQRDGPQFGVNFDQYVQYDDADGTVICDRKNPAAWIRSSELRPCRR